MYGYMGHLTEKNHMLFYSSSISERMNKAQGLSTAHWSRAKKYLVTVRVENNHTMHTLLPSR
ncbi:hypothetical protein GB937_000727 [Aspergillus fischeri]|nr:hypothetical protein GB937_000727 [Aspergillus fischeri]